MIRTKGLYTGQLLYPRAASRQPMITKCDFCWSTEGSSEASCDQKSAGPCFRWAQEEKARPGGWGEEGAPHLREGSFQQGCRGKARPECSWLLSYFFLPPRTAKISPNGFRALDLVEVLGWAVMMPCTHPCSSQRLRIFVCQGSCSPHFYCINKTFQVVSMRRMSAPLTWTETLGFISWDVSCNQRWQMLHIPPHYLIPSNEKQ